MDSRIEHRESLPLDANCLAGFGCMGKVQAQSEPTVEPPRKPSPGLDWPARRDWLSLSEAEVQVWGFHLDLPSPWLTRLHCLLSAEERARAAGFHFTRHRDRFIAGRGTTRLLLGRYLEMSPERVTFVYGPQGKPALDGPGPGRRFHFNLAHSDALGVLAVSRHGPLGIDIEELRPLEDMDELVIRFFSPRERAMFQKLPRSQKPAGFFNLWTRKEAWLKATGEGIAQLLSRVEVSFLPSEPPRLLSVPPGSELFGHWILHGLTPARGYVAALAVPPECRRLTCSSWSNEF